MTECRRRSRLNDRRCDRIAKPPAFRTAKNIRTSLDFLRFAILAPTPSGRWTARRTETRCCVSLVCSQSSTRSSYCFRSSVASAATTTFDKTARLAGSNAITIVSGVVVCIESELRRERRQPSTFCGNSSRRRCGYHCPKSPAREISQQVRCSIANTLRMLCAARSSIVSM